MVLWWPRRKQEARTLLCGYEGKVNTNLKADLLSPAYLYPGNKFPDCALRPLILEVSFY